MTQMLTQLDCAKGPGPAAGYFGFPEMFSVLSFQMDYFYPGYNRDVGNGMEGNNYSCGMGKNGVNFYFYPCYGNISLQCP